MTAQELISSGKLELYVAGVLSEREMSEVATWAQQSPEVTAEIEEIEKVMVNFLSPESETILGEREKDHEINRLLDRIHNQKGPKVVSVNKGAGAHWSPLAVAAVLIGLVATTSLCIFFALSSARLNRQVAILKSQQDTLTHNNIAAIDQMSQMQEQFSMMRNILTKRVELKTIGGTKLTGADSYVVVYWNPGTKKLLLVQAHLPELAPNQQYQLWALYEGKPIDAGVFDTKALQASAEFQKNIDQAQAFAVSVEPRGGSKTPTPQTICLLGKL